MAETAEVASTDHRSQEYLTFSLGSEEYALDILHVQEIRNYEEPTRIANAPAHIRGVMNLRGTIVPVVDMRIKFATGKSDYTPFTVVVILNIGAWQVGIIVDSVSDVVFLGADQIHGVPAFGVAVDTSYIRGMATLDERMLIVIHIDKLMQAGDMALMCAAVAA